MNRRPHEFISCDVHVKHNVNLTNLRVESKEKHACTLHIYRHEHVRTYSGLHAYVSVGSMYRWRPREIWGCFSAKYSRA